MTASGTHAAVRAGVLIGILAIIVLFVAIGVVWMRKAQYARTPHHRANSTVISPPSDDAVAMSYSKAHDLPIQSPKPLPRLYDSGNFSVTSRPYTGFGPPQEPDSAARIRHREMDPKHAASLPSPPAFGEPAVQRSAAAAGSRVTPHISRGLRLTNSDWDETKTQSFGGSELHGGLVQLVTSVSGHPRVTVQDHPSEGLELSPIFASLRLPSPKTPTHPLLGGTKPSRHDPQLDITFAFPSPPPSPLGSVMATISDFSLSSSSSSADSVEGVGGEGLIWSEVFSLDEYDGAEEMLTHSRASIAAVREQLPSPPPTPTPIVLFTPPSPPNAVLAPVSTAVEVDTERLHVWKSAVKKVRTKEDSEPNPEDIFAAGHHYNISGDVNVSLATFAIAHEQAKVARARRSTRGKPLCKSTVALNFQEDSPPAYQSLGYEIQSRLARKRAPSFSETSPTHETPTERLLLRRIASIVKPRPTLENFEPLLCRKVDISKLQAQRLFLGFQAQIVLPNSASGDHDPRRRAVPHAPVDNVGSQNGLKEESIDEAAVMGLAV